MVITVVSMNAKMRWVGILCFGVTTLLFRMFSFHCGASKGTTILCTFGSLEFWEVVKLSL